MSGLEIHQKRQFHPMRWVMLLALIVLLGAYAYYGVRWFRTGELSPLPLPVAAADGSVDETKVTREQVDAYTVGKTEPRTLAIDDFLVKARVQKADLNEKRMFTMPNNLDDVTWYDKSAEPGKGFGAVVIAGRNIGVSRDGTFSKLTKIEERDIIKIERGDGRVFKYEVRETQELPLEDVNKTGMTRMMSSVDKSKEGLNLITDSGKWIPSQKEFDSRIIVYCVLISSK